LEERRLPSTIAWVNRGSTDSDSDSFNAVFGSQAEAARSVVAAALAYWQTIIPHFNYADGSDTLRLTIAVDPNDHTNDAATYSGLATDGQGRPEAGLIHLGAGTDGHGAGWFLDANPLDRAVFNGAMEGSYACDSDAGSPALGKGDLFSIVLHETMHALGMDDNSSLLFGQNAQGYIRATSARDTIGGAGQLYTFAGPDVEALLTSDDSGIADAGSPLHMAAAGNHVVDPVTGRLVEGAVDLMNPIYAWGRRTLPSMADVSILHDVYGYSAQVPPCFVSAASVVAIGADEGSAPNVMLTDLNGSPLLSFYAYDPHFLGGVRVAVGDVLGLGVPQIVTAPGPGGGPDIRIFDSRSGALLREFAAYNPHFTGGIYVAVGDVLGNGQAVIITGADSGGGPHVEVFSPDGRLLDSFMAYSPYFRGGVRVAAGDVDGDGQADIITAPGPGGGPDVRVYSGRTGALIREFMAYDPGFTGGVYVAAGDVNGDHHADIITGEGADSAGVVEVFSGTDGVILESDLAYASGVSDGVHVAAFGTNNGEIVTAAADEPVQVLDGRLLAVLDAFFTSPVPGAAVFIAGA
jgi:hypothetical protein